MRPMPDQIEETEPGTENEVSAEASGAATLLTWLFALAALLLVPLGTREGRRDIGWFQEPSSWPLIVLFVALIGGAAPVLRLAGLRDRPGFVARASVAFDGTTSSLIYGLTFLVFMAAICGLGFSFATILYLQLLFAMSGLRSVRWAGIALLVALTIIACFRVGLGIWFPQPGLADYFPGSFFAQFGEYL